MIYFAMCVWWRWGEKYENKEKTLSISQRKEKKLRSSIFFFCKEFLLIREEM